MMLAERLFRRIAVARHLPTRNRIFASKRGCSMVRVGDPGTPNL
jgi:hypothetical protein